MDSALRSAIDVAAAVRGLYAAFDDRIDGPPAGCPCCVDPEDSRRLVAVRRDVLAGDTLERYAGKAITTWGDERDFRWFLPRIAELMATDGSCGVVDHEQLAHKLVYARWQEWRPAQRAAVAAYFDALWRREIALGSDGRLLASLLEAAGALHRDLSAWLAVAVDHGSPLALAELVRYAFAGDGALAATVRAAVARVAVRERLVTAYVERADESVATAADILACVADLPP
jgi:hypothetical protein